MRRNPGCEHPQEERRPLLRETCDREDGNGGTRDRSDGTPSEAKLLLAVLTGAEWQAKLQDLSLPPDPHDLATPGRRAGRDHGAAG